MLHMKAADVLALQHRWQRALYLPSASHWAAYPDREEIAEANHAADCAPFQDGEVTESVEKHNLGRVFNGSVRAGRLRVRSHPLRNRGRREVHSSRGCPQDVALGEDAGEEPALHDYR